MTWTPDDHRQVGTVLLGSWPGTITAWGKEAFAAYIAELEARGLDARQTITAIRSWPAGSDFPPSAPNLAAAARRDQGTPTFAEAVTLMYGRGGVFAARARSHKTSWEPGERDRLDREVMLQRAASMHPLLASFIARQGIERLRALNLDDEDHGGARRHLLQQEWEQHVDVTSDRDATAIAIGDRRGALERFDPMRTIREMAPDTAQITSGGQR